MELILIYLTTLCLVTKGQQFPGKFTNHANAFASAQGNARAAASAVAHTQPSNLPILRIPEEIFQQFHSQNEQARVPSRVSLEDLVEAEWLEFKLKFNKVYPNPEVEKFRREIFIENRAKIARYNQEYSKGLRNFASRLNPFGDMLVHEFNRYLNGFNRTGNAEKVDIPTPTTFIPSANVIFPDNIDWRQVGAVSSVKNQQFCAGCWAFAAAGALEGHTFRKTGKLKEISVQNLLDCTRPYGNEGCEGGLMDPAFQYVKDRGGVNSHGSYPYEAQEKVCRSNKEDVAATCTGYVDIPEGDEQSLEIAVATLGPVTAAIDASRDTFQFYSEGVYYDPECGNTPEQMNHAVLIVGYGTEPNGQKYWLVKNSYGAEWGIGGYIKLAKNAGNQCGITTQASYPLV